jgi:hypothetical protein
VLLELVRMVVSQHLSFQFRSIFHVGRATSAPSPVNSQGQQDQTVAEDYARLAELTARMARLGASDPAVWPARRIRENIAQQARYLFLRRLGPQAIDSWRDPPVLARNRATSACSNKARIQMTCIVHRLAQPVDYRCPDLHCVIAAAARLLTEKLVLADRTKKLAAALSFDGLGVAEGTLAWCVRRVRAVPERDEDPRGPQPTPQRPFRAPMCCARANLPRSHARRPNRAGQACQRDYNMPKLRNIASYA